MNTETPPVDSATDSVACTPIDNRPECTCAAADMTFGRCCKAPPVSADIGAERKAFEAFYVREVSGCDGQWIEMNEDGRYLEEHTRRAWVIWKARAGAAASPPGWRLVPIEPTPEMLRAVDDEASDKYLARGRAYSAWNSMLAAAPTPTKE